MFKNPKFYHLYYVFYTSFYLILMPTKDYNIRYASIDKLIFSDVINYVRLTYGN